MLKLKKLSNTYIITLDNEGDIMHSKEISHIDIKDIEFKELGEIQYRNYNEVLYNLMLQHRCAKVEKEITIEIEIISYILDSSNELYDYKIYGWKSVKMSTFALGYNYVINKIL